MHEYSCNAWTWTYQIPLLVHTPRCIAIEDRGHGRSSKPLSGYSIQDMAADAAAVMYAFCSFHFETDLGHLAEPFVTGGRTPFILRHTDVAWKVAHYYESHPHTS